MQQVNAEWQAWIRENLARGCEESSIIADMVKGGIDPVAAGIALLQAMAGQTAATAPQAPFAPGPVASGYRYTKARFPGAGSVIQTHDRAVRVAMRMDQPVVALLEDFMSGDECDALVRMSAEKLQRSTIVDPATGQYRVIEDRKSSGTYFRINENELVSRIDRRISDVMHWPVENGEGIQILNYQVGGEYKPHFDYFPPQDAGSSVAMRLGGQRVSTLVIYLNDVPEGGGTVFPDLHLTVSAQKGAAVYFEYCNEFGELDARTLHGGAPVIRGEKWIATKWMRQRRYG